jgi:signal transduction histidine kinase/DNA-binding response OmpR family regulator
LALDLIAYHSVNRLLLLELFFCTVAKTRLKKSAVSSVKNGKVATAINAIIFPSGKEALACRSFALVILTVATVAAFSLRFFDALIYTTASTILMLGFVVIYINHSPEPSSFRVKLVGITLCMVLLLLFLVDNMATGVRINDYKQERLAEVETVKTMLATNGDFSKAPARIAYLVSRPSTRTVWADNYTPLLLRNNLTVEKLVQLDNDNRLQLVRSRTSEILREQATLSDEQARLKAELEISERTLPIGEQAYYRYNFSDPQYQFMTFNFVEGSTLYITGFSYLDFRIALNETTMTLIGLVLLATLVILVVFPFMFYSSFTRPLQALLAGVGKVNAGNLEVEVPVNTLDEIGQLTRSFNNMVVSIRNLDRLKDEFLANTSHELRTPLNGIIGLAESMRDGATGQLSTIQTANLDMIAASGRRLASLVNDILDFSRLKHHELGLSLKPVWVRSMVDVVLTLSRLLAKTKKLELVNSIPPDSPAVLADENRVQQILFNLIGNAIKFTETGKVEVSASVTGNFLSVSVSDTGIGIPADKLDSIFEAFEQADGAINRQYGGAGLGLAITRQLVNLHGGEIRVESKPGYGSCFTFTLPLASATLESQNRSVIEDKLIRPVNDNTGNIEELLPQVIGNQTVAGYKIMIVDDEPVNLQVLQNYLTMQGYDVVQATGGREALELLDNGLNPDLVVLDIMMPFISGYQVCQKIREHYLVNQLPVVMLTARTQVNDLQDGFESGANDYITKPFSKNELVARIKTHLKLAKINAAYNRFVPHEFLQFLEKESIVEVRLGDYVQKEMTIMFSDVRSFTSLSEKMTPKENFDFLNMFLGGVGPCIREHRGFIDKYLGDGIMALFPESPVDAVEAALAMQVQLDEFNTHRATEGYPPIKIGIGLHTGSLILGTIGEEKRMEGTVISDAVNLASRLEGLTKWYGCTLIISEQTLKALGSHAVTKSCAKEKGRGELKR